MKKLTIQLLTIAIAVIAFSATESFAQRRINLDASGQATINATIKPWKVEEGSSSWSISGKQFGNLSIKQTRAKSSNTRFDAEANFYRADIRQVRTSRSEATAKALIRSR